MDSYGLMCVSITGITGFVGNHLAEHALKKGAEVYDSMRWLSRTENIEHLEDQLQLFDCDLKDPSSVSALVDLSRLDYVCRVFH